MNPRADAARPLPLDPGLSSTLTNLVRLARPHQWAKGAFVVIGPAYGIAGGRPLTAGTIVGVIAAVFAFGFASSACYIFNDIRDAQADRSHPRKRTRPIAAGAVTAAAAMRFATLLLALAALSTLAPALGPTLTASHALWLGLCILLYIANTTLYSIAFKHAIVLDVISLAAGFVLRVLGGCAATAIAPSAALLNVTFFLAMFLAFGKRLGERRTMGHDAAAARAVQGAYTDELLRMAVVVTGVATLITYAGYVQGQGTKYELGFNLLWLTMLPATYGLLRCIVLLERGAYDDPTELASRDRPMQAAAVLFGLLTIVIVLGLPLWRGP